MTLTSDLLDQTRDDTKDSLELLFLFGNIGDGTTATVPGDTELESETFRDGIDEFDKSVANKVTASLQILTGEANGTTVSEAGFTDSGTSIVDDCETADWSDSADMTTTLNSTTFKVGSNSLNLTKDATGSAEATTDKTTTSVDFTSKTFSIWVYVDSQAALDKLAVTDCFGLRFGIDGSNYYEWLRDRADLQVGWTLFNNLKSSNADNTVGTPILTAMDFTRVALTATGSGITWSAGDVLMDDLKVFGGTLWLHSLITSINKTDDIQLFIDGTITITVTET